MEYTEFFRLQRAVPVFKTTREVTVPTLLWWPGSAPCDEQKITIPAGTLLRINSYSNYGGEAHSMSPLQAAKVFKRRGNDAWLRFAVIPYSAMEFVEYRQEKA